MSSEGFEDWDEDFLDQLVQAEELALSSTQQPPPPPPPPCLYGGDIFSYSPPRELSQRVVTAENPNPSSRVFKSSNGTGRHTQGVLSVSSGPEKAKEQETDKLKKELGRVSKQLTLLEQECLELRKERDKKEEQLRSVFSGFEAKRDEAPYTKSRNPARESEVHIQDHPGVANRTSSKDLLHAQINVGEDLVGHCTSVCKAIGVQTDNATEAINLNHKDDLSTRRCSKKLIGIWDPPIGSQSGRNLVSKLFVACEIDLLDLLGCLGSSSFSLRTTMDSSVDKSSSDVAFHLHKFPVHSAEAAKVSHLYSMLTKINNDMVTLEALLEALVDICRLESVAIVYKSLRVLTMVLNHCFSVERKSDRRDNVMVERPPYGKDTADVYGSECSEIQSLFLANTNETSNQGHIPFQMSLFNGEMVWKNKVLSISSLDWVSLFELMQQIATGNKEEHVRLEAVSIMNMILMRTNAYSEREKFGQVLVFQSFSQLLRKEAGLGVQKQAVHLLFLLLNCRKLLAMFCSGGKEEGGNAGATNSDATNASVFDGFSAILEGLADCVACNGNDKKGLKLQRNAINLLAFLASSGKSGFEILLGHRLSKRANFLALILQVLISETDLEASGPVQPSEIFKERTLLIRETLILLNRLVSNPQYSASVLRVLTNSRDVASLTIDIASRLSRKGKWLWQSDTMTRQIRESEIVDLAHVFRKRVFTFLGDNIS